MMINYCNHMIINKHITKDRPGIIEIQT